MQKILTYYKLTLLTSVAVVIILMCSFLLLFKNITSSNFSGIYILKGSVPIWLSIVFTILDVAFISNYHHTEEIYLERGISIKRRERRRLSRAQRCITDILKVFSITVIIICIVSASQMVNKVMIEGVIVYALLLLVGICHLYNAIRKT